MAVKATDQITVIDLTDGYSVVLTNEAHTFLGSTNAVSSTQTAQTIVQALCGAEVVPCTIGTITCPTGLSAVSDNKTPNPTITFTATTALTSAGTVQIPVVIGDVTINKTFSWSIAFRGTNGTNGTNGTSVTVSSTKVEYAQVASATAPSSGWSTTAPTSLTAGQYVHTRTTVTFSDGKTAISYQVSRNGTNGSNGSNGTSVTITSQAVTYQTSSSGTTTPTGTWQSAVPSTSAGQYLWTKTVVTYSDGKSTTSYSVSRNGSNGAKGADAITIVVESSNGNIFKNTAIATTLTARVYQAGAEVTGSALTALGTIKWYKDGGSTAVGTGSTLTISAGSVSNSATYVAKLES